MPFRMSYQETVWIFKAVTASIRARTDIKTVFEDFQGVAKIKFQGFIGLKKCVSRSLHGCIRSKNAHTKSVLITL